MYAVEETVQKFQLMGGEQNQFYTQLMWPDVAHVKAISPQGS